MSLTLEDRIELMHQRHLREWDEYEARIGRKLREKRRRKREYQRAYRARKAASLRLAEQPLELLQ